MVVLDTSVVIKWFVKEAGSLEALKYKQLHEQGKERVIAPFLIHYELFNVLAIVQKVDMEDIRDVLKIINNLKIPLVIPSQNQTLLAAKIVQERKVSFYDASYIALALEAKCDFITADDKLVNKVKLPFVKLLR